MECHTGRRARDSTCRGDFRLQYNSFLRSSSVQACPSSRRGKQRPRPLRLLPLSSNDALDHDRISPIRDHSKLTLTVFSPRLLVEKGHLEDAKKSLRWIRGVDDSNEEVAEEIAEIQQTMEFHRSNQAASWKVLFTDPDLFARLWRSALLQFMAQMCGSTAIKYYLPINFLALGLGKELSLLASGIESTLKVGCTIIEMVLVDRLGRRKTLLFGSVIMTVALLVSMHEHECWPGLIISSADQRRPAARISQ